MKTEFDMQLLLDDRHQNVDGDSGPYLSSHRILRGAIKSLDAQMLFDPAEKQFDLPTTAIELGDRQSRQEEVVGEKHKTFLTHSIEVAHSPQSFGIAPLGHGIVEHHDLVALQAGVLVDGLRVQPPTVESLFCPSHKESSGQLYAIESSEVEIGAVHEVNGTRFPDQLIEYVDFVDLSAGDNHHRGNTATQIEQSVKFDSGFAAAKLRPREKRQAQIDRGSVQCVDGVVELDSEGIALIERTCFLDQDLSKLGIDAPVAHLIGVGQSVARDSAANAHVIKLLRCGSKTRFDVSETFSKGQLSKR